MHWMTRPVETLTLFEVIHTYGFIKIMSMIWCIPLAIMLGIILYKTYMKIA